MKVAVPLPKHILALLGVTAAASAIDAGIQKKIHDSGHPSSTTLIMAQALEDSNILLKEVTKTIKNKTKEQKGEFLNMLLGTLGATLLGNILAGKGVVRAGSGGCSLNSSTSYGNKKGKGIVRAGYGNKKEQDF